MMMYVGNVAILENQYIDQQKGIEQDVAGCDCERMGLFSSMPVRSSNVFPIPVLLLL